jgi:hypothetical protein
VRDEKGRPLSYFALDSRFEKARTAGGVKSEEFQLRQRVGAKVTPTK